MADILKGDVVVFKATPNSGEMVVIEVRSKHMQYRNATEDNPAVSVQYWDAKAQRYENNTFYYKDLLLIRRE